MLAVTASHAVHYPASVGPAGFDRLLLAASSTLERLVLARLSHRARQGELRGRRDAAADVRRDGAAVVHMGLLPR